MTTVTKVTAVETTRHGGVAYVTAHFGRGISLTTATRNGNPEELREKAAVLERKIARLQREVDMLRQAADLLEK